MEIYIFISESGHKSASALKITYIFRWIAQRGNHPSIIQWVVFNEAWGQFDTNSVTTDVMKQDPSRLVTGASGWNDHPVGHIVDLHVYPGPSNHGSIVIHFLFFYIY